MEKLGRVQRPDGLLGMRPDGLLGMWPDGLLGRLLGAAAGSSCCIAVYDIQMLGSN
jgi:hypothetical protein